MPTFAPRRPGGRRRSTLVAVTALLPAAALVAGPAAVPASAEPEPEPVIALVVPDRLTAYSEGNRVYTDLGIVLENTGGPLEIWTTRGEPGSDDRYDQGILATTRDSEGNPTGTLGTDSGATMSGLEDVVSVEVAPVRPSGSRLRFGSGTSCLGGEGSQRISPDGVAVSPYPDYCFGGYNSFTLGGVQGIPGGWGSPLLEPYSPLRIPQGRYDVTVTMNDAVADALDVPAEQRTQTMRLKVVPYGDGGGGFRGGPDDADVPLEPAARPRKESAGAPDSAYLPDLQSLPAFGMDISRSGDFLRFSATVWNAGNSPLVVDGFRTSPDRMAGYQYYFNENGEQVGYDQVGEFEWDPKPTHLHWHFQAFAQYSLVPYGAEVDPGDGDGHDHVKSRKEAFCLANTDAVDLTGDGAAWKVDNTDLSTACGDYGSRSIREVLSAGWGDTYAQFRAGQSFNLKGLPNGCYDVVVEGNPVRTVDGVTGRTLNEQDYDNNVARRTIRLSGKDGARKVVVTGVGVVEEGPSAEDLGCVPHDH